MFHYADLFGILTIEILNALTQQPLVRRLDFGGTNALLEPRIELVVGRMLRERLFEFGCRDTPALEHSPVHRAGINVVVDRSRGRGSALIRDTEKPEGIADCFAPTARKSLTISKISRHMAHKAAEVQRVARPSQRTLQPNGAVDAVGSPRAAMARIGRRNCGNVALYNVAAASDDW